MKLLFTGKTDFKYNRVRILIAGLRKLPGIELTVYPIQSRKSFDTQEFKRLAEEADFIYIPPFRHRDVSFIKSLTSKPIVFDPLISKMLTKDDFGQFWKRPFKYFLDKVPFAKCDILLSDTECHKQYFSRVFSIPLAKIQVLRIGVDSDAFYPMEAKAESEVFTVGFYGGFVPLQGTDKIMEAAKLLKGDSSIRFVLIGDGYRFEQAKALAEKYKLNNVEFKGVLPYEALNEAMRDFDLALGIFGDSAKADYVIPNKIYHYASTGKCILSKDTPGIRELFSNGKNIALCDSDPESIAESIRALKANPKKRAQLGQAAAELINGKYNEVEIAKQFLAILKAYQ
ncbi:MAG: glycosyltransferase [Bacteroidetes bacterium]|nr:MAG: glycosyltransferase [Bacteroidota bacterium]